LATAKRLFAEYLLQKTRKEGALERENAECTGKGGMSACEGHFKNVDENEALRIGLSRGCIETEGTTVERPKKKDAKICSATFCSAPISKQLQGSVEE